MSYGVRRSVRAKKQIVKSNSMNASYTTILMFMIKGITCGDVISIDLCWIVFLWKCADKAIPYEGSWKILIETLIKKNMRISCKEKYLHRTE